MGQRPLRRPQRKLDRRIGCGVGSRIDDATSSTTKEGRRRSCKKKRTLGVQSPVCVLHRKKKAATEKNGKKKAREGIRSRLSPREPILRKRDTQRHNATKSATAWKNMDMKSVTLPVSTRLSRENVIRERTTNCCMKRNLYSCRLGLIAQALEESEILARSSLTAFAGITKSHTARTLDSARDCHQNMLRKADISVDRYSKPSRLFHEFTGSV
jgi:hypothetical protein